MDRDQATQLAWTPLVVSAIWWALVLYAVLSVLGR